MGAPDAFNDLRYYNSLGAECITPEKPNQDGFWQELSWENANAYDPDLILVDRRTGNLQPDDLANEAQFSHARHSPLIEQLAAAIGESKKVRTKVRA